MARTTSRPDDLRGAWERYAEEDPLGAIEADPAKRADFMAAGRAAVDWALEWLGARARRERLLEIGCGVGRTAVAFADHFDVVVGVDISSRMVQLGRERGLPPNVELRVNSGGDLRDFPDATLDVVYSSLVLQHLDDDALVRAYLAESARALRPGGCALIQLDTRPRSLLASTAHLLPDRLLPRSRRRFMRRYRRDAGVVREWVAAAGLSLVEERNPATGSHWLMLSRAPPPR